MISEHDIEKGSLWRSKLAGLLHKTKFGIVCLTPENQENPWILFEAGALSKEENPLWTVLFGLKKSDIKSGPLSDINHTSLDEIKDVERLIRDINDRLGEQTLSDQRLKDAFVMWWSKLEDHLKKIESMPLVETPKRPIEEMIEEILNIVRSTGSFYQVRTEVVKKPMVDPIALASMFKKAKEIEGSGCDAAVRTVRHFLGIYALEVPREEIVSRFKLLNEKFEVPEQEATKSILNYFLTEGSLCPEKYTQLYQP